MLPRILSYVTEDSDFQKRTFNNKIAKINNVPDITIEYFGVWARADVLVQLLEHKGVRYQVNEVSQDAWGLRKKSGATGEMG